MKLFRYSGSKNKLASLYRLPSKGFSRIVEPYLGSAGFSLNVPGDFTVLGYEINDDLYDMWVWLKSTTERELLELNDYVEELKSKELKPNLKGLNIPNGPLTYLRVNVCSLVAGQLSSWRIYPQHKLPIQETIKALPALCNFEVVKGSGHSMPARAGKMTLCL